MAHALMVGLDVGIYGRLATRDHILELAEWAESSGVESLWVADHVIFPRTVASTYPYSATGTFPVDMTTAPLLEPMATMGVLVGATQRVRIGTPGAITHAPAAVRSAGATYKRPQSQP
jgi:alkanesulfonate monooxygenase SsuD/methylene tetrahydromethanopterin reductase-like flavin-dependent oxidoreductase (luciferase family)